MQIDLKTVAQLLRERMETLFGDVLAGTDALNTPLLHAAEQRMAGAADALFGEASRMSSAAETADAGAGGLRVGSGAEAQGRTAITQNIYLRENDPSPYKTARAIRRESEAMLRI